VRVIVGVRLGVNVENVAVGVRDGVEEGVCEGVTVNVLVAVLPGVKVKVAAFVEVNDGVGEAVTISDALSGVRVNVFVDMSVTVAPGRGVCVGENVEVGMDVFVNVAVDIRVGVNVFVGVGRSVRVGDGVHVGRRVWVGVSVHTMGVRVEVAVADKAAMNNCLRAVAVAAIARTPLSVVGVEERTVTVGGGVCEAAGTDAITVVDCGGV